MLLVGHGPALPMLLAWPELAVTMETPCVATGLCDYLRVFVRGHVSAFLIMQEAMTSKHSQY